MTSDHHITSDLIHDILDALERHGHVRSDDQHAGRAIGFITDLAHIYEGTQDHPVGAHLIKVPSSLPGRAEHRGQDCHDAVTVVAALDIVADDKCDRAEMRADRADQCCPTCQSRHRDAQAYARLAAQILQTAEAG